MKFSGWNIERFGIFSDYVTENLPDEMTVFLGLNEAGKSTLLAFLRGVLFGYPTGNVKESKYPPLGGGNRAGSITIETSEGQVSIRREESRVQIQRAGSSMTDAELRHLLGGIEKPLFQQVFAFNLWDMRSIETLDEKGVRESVCSAAISGSGRPPAAVIRQLKEEAESLYCPRKTTEASNILARLKDLKAKLKGALDGAKQYSTLLSEEERCSGLLKDLSAREEELRIRRDWFQRLEELWPSCSRKQRAEEELSGLEHVEKFPANPEARLANSSSAVESAKVRIRALDSKLKEREAKTDSLKSLLKNNLPALAVQVREQCERIPLYRDHLSKLMISNETCAGTKKDVDDCVRHLGPEWDSARVEAFDASLPVLKRVNEWKIRLEESSRRLERLESDRQAVERQCAKAASEHERIRKEVDEKQRPDENGIRECEDALDGFIALGEELKTVQSQHDLRLRFVEQVEKFGKARLVTRKTGLISMLLWIVALVALGVASWRIGLGDFFGFGSSLVVAIVTGLAALFIYRLGRPLNMDLQELELQRARNELDKTAERISEIESQISGYAAACGLVEPVTNEQIITVRRDLREKQRILTDLRNAEMRLNDAEERWRKEKEDLQRAEEFRDTEKAEYERLKNEWAGWRMEKGLPGELSPQTVLTILEEVNSAAEKIRKMKRAEDESRTLSEQVGAWERRTRELIKSAGENVSDDADESKLIEIITKLKNECIEDGETRKKIERLAGEIEELKGDVKAAEEELKFADRELEALLREASVDNPAEFEQRLQVFYRREAVSREIATARQLINEAVGRGDEAERFKAELETGQLGLWRENREETENELIQVRERYDEAIKSRTQAGSERRALEAACDIPGIELEISRLRCNLEQVLDKWRVKSIAKAIVEKTLQKYVQETQPKVLADAAEMFAKVTGGRYIRIEQNPDSTELDLRIVDNKSKAKTPEQLSRGTAEQLYLCLRLALVAEFGRQQCTLPLVMDDVLVNFDPVRSRAIAEVLVDFAARNQLLLFTCQPATVNLLSEVGGGRVSVRDLMFQKTAHQNGRV